nr:phage holin family protein [Paenibacillus xylanexedens]
MERWDTLWKWGIALMSSSASYFFGGWSGVLGVLLVFVILDYLTGIAAAGMTGKLESNVGMFGIARKVFIFAMVSVAHLVDGVLGDGHLFRDAVAFFYIANELLSIIENGGKLGAPIPPAIRQAIQVLKGRAGEDALSTPLPQTPPTQIDIESEVDRFSENELSIAKAADQENSDVKKSS